MFKFCFYIKLPRLAAAIVILLKQKKCREILKFQINGYSWKKNIEWNTTMCLCKYIPRQNCTKHDTEKIFAITCNS